MSDTFNCPTCGAPLDYDGKGSTMRCPYCNSSVIVPEKLRREPYNGDDLGSSPTTSTVDFLEVNAGRLREIGEIARMGNKIEAIKQYRELTNVGLKEAKDAVEAMMEGRPVQFTSVSVSTGQVSMDEIMQLIRQGHKIEAIKRYRQMTGMGLKEAKDAVEAIEAANTWGTLPSTDSTPQIQIVTPTYVQPQKGSTCFASCIGWLILLGILAGVLVPVGIGLFGEDGPLAGLWQRQVAPLIQQVVPTEMAFPLMTPISVELPGKAKPLLLFGGDGTGPGKFKDGRAITVDRKSGNIYVAEYQGGRVQVFDAEGKFVTQWQVGDDKNTIISSIAADRKGNVYMVVGSELYKFDGETGISLGQLEHPEGWGFDSVAVGLDDSVVAGWYKNRDDVIRFNSTGKVDWLVKEAISGESGDSELDIKVAVDGEGTVFALGAFNNAVFVYSSKGKYVNRFGSEGDEAGQFRATGAIVVDSQSQVYISDIHGIQVFTHDGRYVKTIPADTYAYGLAFDDQDNLYMTTNQKMVAKVSTK